MEVGKEMIRNDEGSIGQTKDYKQKRFWNEF
jgi:hypothetical protein